jgi:hypothetical protein
MNGDPPGGREPDDHRTLPDKVIVPGLPSRVEERHDLSHVDPREIRALMPVTAVTRIAKSVRGIGSTVLLRNDVLNVEADSNELLRKAAVLAPVTGSLSDEHA